MGNSVSRKKSESGKRGTKGRYQTLQNQDHRSLDQTDGNTKQRIEEASVPFIPPKSFNLVKNKLEELGHVTILGASGEGKTAMSLILAGEYLKKGYRVVFVDKIDGFDLNECSASKLFLIIDDIFGTVGLSKDDTQVRNMLNSIFTQLRRCKLGTTYPTAVERRNNPKQSQMNHKQRADIRVVFTSKTYNFQSAMSLFQNENLFVKNSLVDVTSNKHYRYSQEDKVAIFDQYTQRYGDVDSVSPLSIWALPDALFGFPMTCRLFFEPTFHGKDAIFFHRPLHFLKLELSRLLSQQNEQTAALVLMILSENELILSHLEHPGQDQILDDRFKILSVMYPSVTRLAVCTAARHFRGTLFTFGDILQFTPPSVYDASACALYEFSPVFVLRYCSVDLLYEQLRTRTHSEDKTTDQGGYIFVSEEHFDDVVSRLCSEIIQGKFMKTITHPILENELIVRRLFQKLQTESSESTLEATHWIHRQDNGKGFLFLAVHGHSSLLVEEVEDILGVRFTESEIREALDATVDKDNVPLLKLFLSRLDIDRDHTVLDYLLLLSAKYDSSKTAEYLMQIGADVNAVDDNNRNFAHLACYLGNANMLAVLMIQKYTLFEKNRSVSLNSVDIDGRTPAMLAAAKGSEECFQLVMNETNMVKDYFGNSSIHLACYGGYITIVQHLISPVNINSRGQHGWTPVMMSVVNGHRDVFDFLVSNDADLTLVDAADNTLLQLACGGGNIAIVRQLVSSSNINTRGEHGWTPIMKAADSGHQTVFDFLVSNNADLTLVSDTGDRLVHLACEGGNEVIVQQVISSSNINCRGENGLTPVMVAAVNGNLTVFDFLTSCNVDLTLVADDGDSLLHLACQGGSTDIVKQLVSPSNINSRGEHNWTPVMVAIAFGQLGVFEFLRSNNAEMTILDDSGDSLLHLACQGGNTAIVQQLVSSSNINSRGEKYWTPAMVAVESGHLDAFDFLVSKGADLTLVDGAGDGLLHLACQGGNVSIVRRFVSSSNINTIGMHGWTPIMKTVVEGHPSVFEFLRSNNAEMTVTSNKGDSILHLACQGGNTAIVKQLVSPSNINSRGMRGGTPAMKAAYCGHKEVLELLIKNNADLTLKEESGKDIVGMSVEGGHTDIVEFLTLFLGLSV